MDASKSKMGTGLLGGTALGGVVAAGIGAYGGYKLGKMVGSLGRDGHYGYFESGRYYRCDPPPRIEFDYERNISYIPLDANYDKRCYYFDRDPSRDYGYKSYTTTGTITYNTTQATLDYSYNNQNYQNYRYGINWAQNMASNISCFAIIVALVCTYFT